MNETTALKIDRTLQEMEQVRRWLDNSRKYKKTLENDGYSDGPAYTEGWIETCDDYIRKLERRLVTLDATVEALSRGED